MRRAVDEFENDFARWGLHLPADAVETRRGGQIRHAGWSVRYNFGTDGVGDYLDYYASPRDVQLDPPGDDWHVRLYASGERALLPTVLEAYMYGRDPTWEELERARSHYLDQLTEPAMDAAAEGEAVVSPAETSVDAPAVTATQDPAAFADSPVPAGPELLLTPPTEPNLESTPDVPYLSL